MESIAVGFPNLLTYHDPKKTILKWRKTMTLLEAIEETLRVLRDQSLLRVERKAGASNNITVLAYRLPLNNSKKKKLRIDITYEERKDG